MKQRHDGTFSLASMSQFGLSKLFGRLSCSYDRLVWCFPRMHTLSINRRCSSFTDVMRTFPLSRTAQFFPLSKLLWRLSCSCDRLVWCYVLECARCQSTGSEQCHGRHERVPLSDERSFSLFEYTLWRLSCSCDRLVWCFTPDASRTVLYRIVSSATAS